MQFRSCAMRRVQLPTPGALVNDGEDGDFIWGTVEHPGKVDVLTLWVMVPCIWRIHGIPVYRAGEQPPAIEQNCWEWDGDEDKPTLNPSISTSNIRGEQVWHGFVRAGRLEACE